jgi:hypothetical protein
VRAVTETEMKTKITLRELMQPEQQLKLLFRRRRNSGSFIRECRYVGKNNLKEDEHWSYDYFTSNFSFHYRLRKTLGINGAVIVKKFNNKNLRSVITLLRILLVTCEEGVVDPAKVTLAYKTQPLLLV